MTIDNMLKIKKVNDSTLLDEVKSLVQREKEIVVEVIEYLKEIELRKLHLVRGYSSLFAFATDFLGYSEAEAHIRIQAARLTQVLPEVKRLIETGEITLSVAATAQTHFRKENLRRKEVGKPSLSVQEKRHCLEQLAGSTRREAELSLSIHFAQQGKKSYGFDATPELVEKIERLMDLMAHKNFDRDLAKMMELLVDAELARYESKKGLVVSEVEIEDRKSEALVGLQKDNREKPIRQLGNEKRRRYIPRSTRGLVWAKNNGQCTYRDPLTGKKCNATHGLEIDHRLAFGKGGGSNLSNLALLCRSHNLWKGERQVE